jgi:putative DNA primase/helicase
VDLKFGRNWGDAKHTWEELHGQSAQPAPTIIVEAVTVRESDAASLEVGKLPTSDQRNKPQPITSADIEEINRGLQDWGIEPLHIGDQAPPPWESPAQILTASANPQPSGHGDASPRSSGNGRADNGYDAGGGAQPAGKARGNYRDISSEKHAGKPYAPVRAALLRKGYQVARTFAFAVPGEAEPRFYEDRYELHLGIAASEKRPRKTSRYWRREDGKDLNGTGPRRIIYNWPAIMTAGPGANVLVTEGANKSESLNKAGLLGTAAPYHQWGEECVQALAGDHLFYLADHNPDGGNDPGPKYAADAREKLGPHAASFRIVPAAHLWKHLPPGVRALRQGDDVKDWLELGGDPTKLLDICREIPDENAQSKYITTNLATVRSRAVRWVWPGHLARGGLELLAGTPEIGKSQIHCQYIACATTGRDWPNGVPGIVPCRVILLTAEDTIEDTLVPRLKAAGAELALIEEFKAVRRNDHDEMFLLGEDLDTLEQMIQDFGDIGLVTIDPITAYMGHAKHFDSHRASDVRSQLSPLKRLAERTGVAFSAITHPPKNASPRALDHFIGSQAFIAAARIGHLCVAEMEEGENGAKRETGRRFFTNPKINIGARQTTLVYRIKVVELDDVDIDTGELIKAPVVCWEGESEFTAEEALAAARPAKGGKSKSPQEFLTDVLISGPVLQKTIVERGAERGFSLQQLKRAKKTLDVEAFRKKGLRAGPSYWAFPEHVPPETEPDEQTE